MSHPVQFSGAAKRSSLRRLQKKGNQSASFPDYPKARIIIIADRRLTFQETMLLRKLRKSMKLCICHMHRAQMELELFGKASYHSNTKLLSIARSLPFFELQMFLEKNAEDLHVAVLRGTDPHRAVVKFLEQVSKLSRNLEKVATRLLEGHQLDTYLEVPHYLQVPDHVRSLVAGLKYYSSDLADFKVDYSGPHITQYLEDILRRLSTDVDALADIFAVASAKLNLTRKTAVEQLLNQLTGASFFSSVTATTIQFSYQQTRGVLMISVNAFWFTSMVFSITAAGVSLLGLAWRNSNYYPYRLPLLRLWVERLPAQFLALAVACFSIGFVLFSYASAQSLIISVIVTSLSVIFAVGIFIVTIITGDIFLYVPSFMVVPRRQDQSVV